MLPWYRMVDLIKTKQDICFKATSILFPSRSILFLAFDSSKRVVFVGMVWRYGYAIIRPFLNHCD